MKQAQKSRTIGAGQTNTNEVTISRKLVLVMGFRFF